MLCRYWRKAVSNGKHCIHPSAFCPFKSVGLHLLSDRWVHDLESVISSSGYRPVWLPGLGSTYKALTELRLGRWPFRLSSFARQIQARIAMAKSQQGKRNLWPTSVTSSQSTQLFVVVHQFELHLLTLQNSQPNDSQCHRLCDTSCPVDLWWLVRVAYLDAACWKGQWKVGESAGFFLQVFQAWSLQLSGSKAVVWQFSNNRVAFWLLWEIALKV